MQTKADRVREWLARNPEPACIADLLPCEAETGVPVKQCWIIARHDRTPEQRQTYFREYSRNRYATDPAFRERVKAANARYKERKRLSAQRETPAEA